MSLIKSGFLNGYGIVLGGGSAGGDPIDMENNPLQNASYISFATDQTKLSSSADGVLVIQKFDGSAGVALNCATDGVLKVFDNDGAAVGKISFGGTTLMSAPSDGNLLLTNAAGTAFSLLQLGGTTSAYPAILRNGAGIRFRLADASGDASIISGAIQSTGNVTAGNASGLGWTGRSFITSPSDGNITLFNNSLNNFTTLQFGGTSSSFPGIKRSSATLAFRLADDSADAAITSAGITSSGNIAAAASGTIGFTGRTIESSPSDGVLTFTNAAASDFTRLQLGGTSSSFPAIKRSAATLAFRVADDSADASFSALTGVFSGVIRVADGSSGATAIQRSSDAGTGIWFTANTVNMTNNVSITTGLGNFTFTGSAFTLPATSPLVFSSRARMASSADGVFQLTNNANTTGVAFDVATDGVLKLYDNDASTTGVLSFGVRARLTSSADGKLSITNAAATAGGVIDVTTDTNFKLYGRDASTAGLLWLGSTARLQTTGSGSLTFDNGAGTGTTSFLIGAASSSGGGIQKNSGDGSGMVRIVDGTAAVANVMALGITFHTGGATRTKLTYGSADGALKIQNIAATAGGVVDLATNGIWKLYAIDNTTAGTLSFAALTRLAGATDGKLSITKAAGTGGLIDVTTDGTFNLFGTDGTTQAPVIAGSLKLTQQNLTAGTMTETNKAEIRTAWARYDWTNAMVTALGATTTGDVTVCTLPAKTMVHDCYMVVDTAAGTVSTLFGAVGRTAAGYIDYIVSSDLKAAANTIYGNASAERGTNLTGYDLISATATTDVKMHFISTGGNLNTVTTCTGHIYLNTVVLP